jgi:hypothetical protein
MRVTNKSTGKYVKKNRSKLAKAIVKYQLEIDALKIINGKLGTRYRSLKQVSLEEIININPTHQ